MSQIAQRPKYRPSGRVAWGKFLPLFLLSLLVAVALAAVMYWSFTVGWYLLFITPIVAGLLLSLFLTLAVRVGRCRSPLVAGFAGILAGAVLYFGYYYFGLLSLVGIRNAHRLDYLPSYINLRWHLDTHRDVGHSDRPERAPDPYLNGGVFFFELGGVLWIVGMMTWRRARNPYCERCDRWQQQDVAMFPPDSGKSFREWIEQGQVARLASIATYAPAGRSKRFTSVAVSFCEPDPTREPCPVYLAVKDVSLGGTATTFQKFDGSPGKVRLPRIELTRDEAASLTPIFPRLRTLVPAGTAPAPDAMAPASPSIPAILGGPALIEVQPLPEVEARKVLNGRTIAVGNILGLLSLVVFVAGLGGVIGGLFFANLFDVLDHKAKADPLHMGVGLGGAAVCLVVMILSGFVALRNSSFPGNVYYYRRARHFFALRPSPFVDVNRPSDQPVFFVEIVPRKNWGKIMLETATDIGFMEVDGRRREIRFEGDRERYRIPANAITGCRVEQVSVTAGESNIVHHMVVVSGRTKAGDWEAPFCLRQTKWNPPKKHREIGASEIYSAICAIAPWVIPGVAQRIANPPLPQASAQPRPISLPPPPPVPGQPVAAVAPVVFTPPKVSFFKRHGLRLTIIVVAIGLGLWRGYAKHHARDTASGVDSGLDDGPQDAHGAASMPLHIANVRRGQKFNTKPPYFQPGGQLTVFEVSPADDPGATVLLAVGSPIHTDKSLGVISFSTVSLVPTDREKGGRFVADLAKSLHRDAPPNASELYPLKPHVFPFVLLGENLSDPESGLRADAGHWVATKWFLGSEESSGEIFFNYDLTTNRAEFSEKDPAYDDAVLANLAAMLRDGEKPQPAATQKAPATRGGNGAQGASDLNEPSTSR